MLSASDRRGISLCLEPAALGVSTLLAGAKLVCLLKKDGGIRPIAVGELLRRIAGKCLLARYQGTALPALAPEQHGVAAPLGMERITHQLQLWARGGGQGECLLQLDLSNAFGSLSRDRILEAVAAHCPSLLPYAVACYARPTQAVHPAATRAVSLGVQQGDPLSPLFFALGIQPEVHAVSAGVRHKLWYLDDGTLVGTLRWCQPRPA